MEGPGLIFTIFMVFFGSGPVAGQQNLNCVYGGGSCSLTSNNDGEQILGMKERTFILFMIFMLMGIGFSILVICCFVRKCPCFGDCERSRGLRKPR